MSEVVTAAKPHLKGPIKPSAAVAPKKAEPDTIVFRAFRPKTQRPVKVSPLPDSTGKHWTGQGATGYFEDMTEEDKKKESFVITPLTTVVISEGKVLNCKQNRTDAANWKWIKKHPYIALSKEAGSSSRDAVYYVFNQVAIAEERVTKGEKTDIARYKIRMELSAARQAQIAEALGFPEPRAASPVVVTEWLLDNASENAEMILKLINEDEEAKALQKAMALFHILNRYKIIQQYRAGMWRWAGENGLVLGATKERAIEFMANPDNADTVAALEAELAEKKLIEEQL